MLSNKTIRQNTGDRGEDIVCEFLVKQGLTVVERNHWRKWGEIDIVARSTSFSPRGSRFSRTGQVKNIDSNVIHFIEVKSAIRDLSRGTSFDDGYSPADNVTHEKKKRLGRVIQTYVLENKLEECDWQADVALVYMDSGSDKYEIEILEDIDL